MMSETLLLSQANKIIFVRAFQKKEVKKYAIKCNCQTRKSA